MGTQLILDKDLYPEQKLLLATPRSFCFDLRAREDVVIQFGQVVKVPLGVWVRPTTTYTVEALKFYIRSGLAAKHGVTVLNSPGTVDCGYRGEIKVILINHGDKPFVIHNGDRIAQGVVATVSNNNIIKLNKVDSISEETDRGSGGFGSTGVE